MKTTITLVLPAFISAACAGLSGQATTTRYHDGHRGACGCGPDKNTPFAWQSEIEGSGSGNATVIHTAAGSPSLFDTDDSVNWCGTGCGKCYKLTSTGQAPPGQGTGGQKGESVIVMITNLCPNNGINKFCPNAGDESRFGYKYHFDIMTADSDYTSEKAQVIGDNPIVDFEEVDCPDAATSDYGQCQCAKENK